MSDPIFRLSGIFVSRNYWQSQPKFATMVAAQDPAQQ